jgi:(1->4)-alpha-D-glucan 1-alpha-D-glucosylmutase
MNPALLDTLCSRYGIQPEYKDAWGHPRRVPNETRMALLTAMGVEVSSDDDLERALGVLSAGVRRRVLPPVHVARRDGGPISIPLAVPEQHDSTQFAWTITLEDGGQHGGSFMPRDLERAGQHAVADVRYGSYILKLTEDLPLGYHALELRSSNDAAAPHGAMRLIVAPRRCYLPDALKRGGRVWGPVINLYGLRSNRNWGIGDFTDLRRLVEITAAAGGNVVGVNPLHALLPHDPEHASPYSPSSRVLLNILYLDPEAIPEYADCEAAREMFEQREFQQQVRALREGDRVDYSGVARLKTQVLSLAYAHFRERHLGQGTERERAFREFQSAGGDTLRRASLFYALQDVMYARDKSAWGWRAWPAQYRDPQSAEVLSFARDHIERVEYYDYLQWTADSQLALVGQRALELELGVGIYLDLAVGVDSGGAETWGQHDLYAESVTIGCPPDEFGPTGQDWGIPPLLPERLYETAYAPFIALLQANMRHAGALRIDHFMGLMRQFWVPAGNSPQNGGYVAYPTDDLFGVLALESERNSCMVIAEDLGTLPEGLAERLEQADILSYRLLYFQREADGAFTAPANYPQRALAAVSTHDLPTLRAWWLGRDLDLRKELGLFPSDAVHERQLIDRAQARAQLLLALGKEGLLPAGTSADPLSAPDMSVELMLSIHRFLARAPSHLLMVQPEDVFGQVEQINVPSTSASQYPNWRQRVAISLEDWRNDKRFDALADALQPERGGAASQQAAQRFETRIPDATYRLQFNKSFTFAQAAELVPYLRELGVSHCYASPYFSARPGSVHGYDIVDHNAFNAEIGSAADFERFVDTLKQHAMGHIIDMVPNHMGIMGSDNMWWLDVLENGPASEFAAYFDIDWDSAQVALRGKVLVPVLGNHYGIVLERKELQLQFEEPTGAFSIHYYQHRFPVDPSEYPRILHLCTSRLAESGNADPGVAAEFQALVTSFGHLPCRNALEPEAVNERQRDKAVHKQHLARLCERSREIRACIGDMLREVNGIPGNPASFEALDRLLEMQAYRLAYWRVASDEINYRRFFDINDLAALRTEDERVFEATHRLLFRLLGDGKIDGVRIDHPDGLHDPLQYVQRLQARVMAHAGVPASRGEAPARPLYLVIEKILADFERLPEHWPVHGTTGYRFANLVNALFVDVAAETRMDRIYEGFIRERPDYDAILFQAKLLIIRTALAAELNVLANRLVRIARADRHTRDFTLNSLREVLAAVVAGFPVYRTYISDSIAAEDKRYIEWAVAAARRSGALADADVFEFVRRVLLREIPVEEHETHRTQLREFVMRFQQFTSPVAAKGMEDTAFYRYNRLVSLNEVGGNPRCFGISLKAFHHASLDRARYWSHTMLATSTHDNKRSEDVRVRIDAISEFPEEWSERLLRWRRINRRRKRQIDGLPAPSANDEYLFYQILTGTWPIGEPDEPLLGPYRERIQGYMLKAVREAKVRTSWTNANAEYESATAHFVQEVLSKPQRNPFIADFAGWATRLARIGMFNSLSQTVIKIASPGVPDFYQGNELWDDSLVDPDNRRPVDYARRARMLDALKARQSDVPEERLRHAEQLLHAMDDGTIKLYVTWRGLALRTAMRDVFTHGEYVPIETRGMHADRICAFARIHGRDAAIAVAPRLVGKLVTEGGAPLREAWSDTVIVLPQRLFGDYCNAYTGECVAADTLGVIPASRVFNAFPVALLHCTQEKL